VVGVAFFARTLLKAPFLPNVCIFCTLTHQVWLCKWTYWIISYLSGTPWLLCLHHEKMGILRASSFFHSHFTILNEVVEQSAQFVADKYQSDKV
jgi:hypothetical protein